MLLTRLLNACHHFPGFVYAAARLCTTTKTIEIDVRPRARSKPCCSVCHQPSLTTDRIAELRQRAAGGAKKTALAREFGVSRETVYAYLSGEPVKRSDFEQYLSMVPDVPAQEDSRT